MKRFRLKKSRNEDILQPIVKVTQNLGQDKHYFNKAKWGLINYLKSEKEGKVKLYENGNFEGEDLKHIIISPCKINAWEQMNRDERMNLREAFINKLKTDFRNKNYLLAIEEKVRINEKNEEVMMEHYHLVISNKIPTDTSFKISYKKSLMTEYIEHYTTKNTRAKLGIKTFNEIKEHKILKLKQHHNKKLKSMIVKDELTTLFQISKDIFKSKQDTLNFTRVQKHYVLKEKKNIFKDISSISQSIKSTNSHIKFLDNVIKDLSSNKNLLVRQFTKEIFKYKKRTQSELEDFTFYSNKEHSFFMKLQQYKLKNGVINQEEFLTSMARSKTYWNEEKILRNRNLEQDLKDKQKAIENQINNIQVEILCVMQNLSHQKDLQKILNTKIDVRKYLLNSKDLQLKSNEEILQERLKIYDNFFKYINGKITHKKEEQLSINQDNNSLNNYTTF